MLGEPVPKARARVTGRGTYTPARTAHAELAWEWLLKSKCRTPITGHVIVEADFYLGNKRRCDADNLLKLFMDSANGIVWKDDSQVIEIHVSKHVDREQPRSEVRVWKVGV